MLRRLTSQVVCLALAAIVLLLLPSIAGAELSQRRLRALKRLQHQLLLSEPEERMEERRERRAEAEKNEERKKRGERAERSADQMRQRRRTMDERDRPRPLPASPDDARTSAIRGIATPINVLVNDPTGEHPGLDSVVQSEVSIAAFGNYMLAGWNDGVGHLNEEKGLLGFGYSTDGGATWVDGGAPPATDIGLWTSDPVIAVNEKTGVFYFIGLIDVSETVNGIGLASGSFVGDTFTWNPPVVVTQELSETTSLDKCWVATDSLSGNIYITYSHFDGSIINTVFVPTSDRIRVVRSTDGGVNWDAPQTLSHPSDDGFVQGSRPAVGPDGELYVVWQAVGQASGSGFNSPFGRDYMRIRKSADLGVSFDPEVTADSVFANFSNGGPGFNRGSGLTLPSIAVDRSAGPHRGRVYLTWNESINFYDAPLPNLPAVPPFPPGVVRTENEPNDGGIIANTFNVGQALSGRVGTATNDQDFWVFNGIKGQTIVCYMDQIQSTLNPEFSIRCSEGTVRLAFNNFGIGRRGLLVFTCPKDTTYFVRMAAMEQASSGTYRILTAWDSPAGERARDHRDVFVKWSDDGVTWGPTVRTNDSEGNLDDWLPEIAVDGTGRVFSAHYDFREDATLCNAPSNVYLTRSDDGGSTWLAETRISDVSTNWTTTGYNIEPNQGDYIGLFARDTVAVVGWGDGRQVSMTTTDTDPNVFVNAAPLDCSHAPVTAVDTVGTTRNFIQVNWTASPGFAARVIRQVGGVDVDLGIMTADGDGHIVMQDATALPQTIYVYRLEADGYCERSMGAVVLQLPCVASPLVTVDGTAVTMDSVTVTWSAAPGFNGFLSRREGNGSYVVQFPVTPDPDGKIIYVDQDITPGLAYSYRLDVEGYCKAFVGEVTIQVAPFQLAMRVQNPTIGGDILVNFTIPNGNHVDVYLYDLNGRMVVSRQADNFGPGPHVINMTPDIPISAGVYFVVLTQGGTRLKQRVAVIR